MERLNFYSKLLYSVVIVFALLPILFFLVFPFEWT